jgi:hypothetical protein
MKTNTFKVFTIGFAFFFAALLIFIKFSNNHIECETVTDSFKDKGGNKVLKTSHICHEKFNL